MQTTLYFLFQFGFSPAAAPPSPPPPPPPLSGGQQPAVQVPTADVVDDDTLKAVLALWRTAGDVDPVEAIDDDTEAAAIALWESAVQLSSLFASPPRTGRLKSTAPGQDVQTSGPYVVLDSKLLKRDLIGADKDGLAYWNDYREVTMTVYGLRADVVKGIGLILAVFNRKLGAPGLQSLSYPSGARFMRWWPVGNAVIEEDKDAKAGKDVWKGTIKAEVWSVRAV